MFFAAFSTMKLLDAKVALSELAKNGTEALVNGGMGALQSVLGFACRTYLLQVRRTALQMLLKMTKHAPQRWIAA